MDSIKRWLVTSPPVEFAIAHLKKLLIGAIRQGPIPRQKIETAEGHHLGVEALVLRLYPEHPPDTIRIPDPPFNTYHRVYGATQAYGNRQGRRRAGLITKRFRNLSTWAPRTIERIGNTG